MIPQLKIHRRKILSLILGTLLVVNIVVLSPQNLEEDAQNAVWSEVDPKDVLAPQIAEPPILAPDIPHEKIPDYKLKGFYYNSTTGEKRHWKLIANNANMFNKERLVHARQVRALLFNPNEAPTIITGKEAKYFLDRKELEVFGNVVTTFPDGFKLYSEYLKYYPSRRNIQITENFKVRGGGKQGKDQDIQFRSLGFSFDMKKNRVRLPKNVFFKMNRHIKDIKTNQEKIETTLIQSDYSIIERSQNISKFYMNDTRPLDKKFVIINQPDTFIQSRWAEVNYQESGDAINYMVAHEDVYIEETEDNEKIRYATCGKADFINSENIIILRKLPQVYQGGDTVTGEVIQINRNTDIVEVERSNAYSQGNDNKSNQE